MVQRPTGLELSDVREQDLEMAARHGVRVWLALVTVYLVWGSTFIALAIAIRDLPPFLAMSVRHLIAGTVLLVFALPRGDRSGDRIGRRQIVAGFIFGGLLFVTGHGALAWAQQTVPAGVAALLVGTIPIWMALFDRIGFGRRLPATAYVGIAVGFAGLAFLFDPFGSASVDRLGALVIVVSAMCWAVGSLYSRGAPLPKRPLVSAGLASLCGGILLAGYSTVSGEIGEATWTTDALLAIGLPHRRGELRRLHRLRVAASLCADLARLHVCIRQSDRRGRARRPDSRRGHHRADDRRRRGRSRVRSGDSALRRNHARARPRAVHEAGRDRGSCGD